MFFSSQPHSDVPVLHRWASFGSQLQWGSDAGHLAPVAQTTYPSPGHMYKCMPRAMAYSLKEKKKKGERREEA